MTTTISYDRLPDLTGVDLGHSAYRTVTQEQVNLFADATGDHQWIHVDVERAKAESPFGGPIAHGYLTLSLVNTFLPDLVQVKQFSAGVNYGTDKTRFPAPVPVGSRIRGTGTVTGAAEVKGWGGQVHAIPFRHERSTTALLARIRD